MELVHGAKKEYVLEFSLDHWLMSKYTYYNRIFVNWKNQTHGDMMNTKLINLFKKSVKSTLAIGSSYNYSFYT